MRHLGTSVQRHLERCDALLAGEASHIGSVAGVLRGLMVEVANSAARAENEECAQVAETLGAAKTAKAIRGRFVGRATP
jgi:hypothetical protein